MLAQQEQEDELPCLIHVMMTPYISLSSLAHDVCLLPGPSLASLASTFLEGLQLQKGSLVTLDWRGEDTEELYLVTSVVCENEQQRGRVTESTCFSFTAAALVEHCNDESAQSWNEMTIKTWRSDIKKKVFGCDDCIESIIQTVHQTLRPLPAHLHQCRKYYPAPRVHLISGVHGSGKTWLIQTTAQTSPLYWRTLELSKLFQRYEGEGEKQLRAVFDDVLLHSPSFLLIDDVDVLSSPVNFTIPEIDREQESTLERSLSVELYFQLDRLCQAIPDRPVFVLLTATNTSLLSDELVQSGRIEQHHHLIAPDFTARVQALQTLTSRFHFDVNESVDALIADVAASCQGYTISDLTRVCQEAVLSTFSRYQFGFLQQNEQAINNSPTCNKLHITSSDFLQVLDWVRPANLTMQEIKLPRSLKLSSPFEQLAGLERTIQPIRKIIIEPLRQMAQQSKHNVQATLVSSLPHGLLLYGPSGCAKSSLALAIACATGLTPLIVQTSSIVSKVVGESERTLTSLFASARVSAPCVLILDDIDVIGEKRRVGIDGNDSFQRLLSCLLQELDGIGRVAHTRSHPVFVIATTSRPRALDSALIRSGRLDYHVHCPRPNVFNRFQILMHIFKRTPLLVSDFDAQRWWSEAKIPPDIKTAYEPRLVVQPQMHDSGVNLDPRVSSANSDFAAFIGHLALETEDFSGADLQALVREAVLAQLRDTCIETLHETTQLHSSWLLKALATMTPSLREVRDEHPSTTQPTDVLHVSSIPNTEPESASEEVLKQMMEALTINFISNVRS